MKFGHFAAAVLILAPAGAMAAHVAFPAQGASACYTREYTGQQMAGHPNQKLNRVFVKIANRLSAERDYNSATVVATGRDGQFYSNDNAGCEQKKDGTLLCSVECDGGSFSLIPLDSRINLKVTPDYYFPLYKPGADIANPRPEDQLSLMGADKDNNLYRLFPADMGQCDAAWEAAKSQTPGC